MAEFFIQLLFFPAAFVSMIVSVIGILKAKYWLVIIGAVLFLPFSYYMFGASHASPFAFLPLLCLLVSAAAVREKNKLWAWILLAPSFLLMLWIVSIVLLYQLR
jgi:hypothetical protein